MMYQDFKKGYHRFANRKKTIILIMAVLGILVGFLEIPLGPYHIGFFEAYQTLFDHMMGIEPVNMMNDYVVWEKSTPRAIAAVAAGAGLGVCGAAMQSALKNPLADPYMTGIASGADFGVSLAVIAGIVFIPFLPGTLGMISNAFVLSLIPAMVIIGISSLKKRAGPTMMILIGIAVMYVFSAFTTMLKLAASDEAYAEVFTWSLGTLGSSTWNTVPFLIFAAVVGITVLYMMHAKLNLLSTDDGMALSSGIDPKRVRLIAIVVVSLVTATLVCFTGTIGFVGLVAPHIMRIFIGSDNRFLIPASAACGAFVLACSDCIAIEVISTGLPVGVITSLIGGPLFIYILINQHKKVWN